MATLTFPPSSSPHTLLPAIASPLSPRSANIHGRHPPRAADVFMSNSNENSKQSNKLNAPSPAQENIFQPSALAQPTISTTSTQRTPFSRRPIKQAPALGTSRSARAETFLRKVSEARDEKRFAARGEEILRADWERERREWRERVESSAPVVEEEEYEECGELPGWEEAEREERELQALLELMPEDGEAMDEGEDDAGVWSDGADYEALFSEVLSQEQQGQQQQQQSMQVDDGGPRQQQVEDEEMDMS